MKSAIAALAACIAGAGLEGVLAGRGVRRRLAELRQPPYSPPFVVWMGIGLAYYVICFVLLSRLIGSVTSPLRWWAVVLVLILMAGNAIWNLVFFRFRDIDAGVAVSAVYAALAVVLAIVLLWVDPVGAWVLLPYLVYLAYAAWWMLALRRLNREVAA